MARRESAHLALQGCFLREQCSPFVPVMAKQRRSAVPAAPTMCVPQPNRQMKTVAMWPGLLQVSLPGMRPLSLEAKSRATPLMLLQAKSRVKTAD
jgi:hypothetical protein